MLHFILKNLDSNKPTAVIAVLVDFSKAFNRICHNRLLTILADLNIPSCALKLIASYLTNRRMCVRHSGAVSDFQQTPGGGPQGSLLIVLFFILLVNDAGRPCPIKPTLPVGFLGPEPSPSSHCPDPDQSLVQPHLHEVLPEDLLHDQGQVQPIPPCHNSEITDRYKYVDDLSLLETFSQHKL